MSSTLESTRGVGGISLLSRSDRLLPPVEDERHPVVRIGVGTLVGFAEPHLAS